jgi:TPR repeat protein
LFHKGGVVRQDLNQAHALFREACEAGSVAGCSRLAAMRDSGDVIGQDLAEAKALYAQTCKQGVFADCYRLAELVRRDRSASSREIFKLFEQACEGDVAAGCYEVAIAWEGARDPLKALPYYQKACSGGHKAACTRVRRLQQ